MITHPLPQLYDIVAFLARSLLIEVVDYILMRCCARLWYNVSVFNYNRRPFASRPHYNWLYCAQW